MNKKISTKELLVNSALELIQTMTFDEMTVQTIVENCGVARKTFYNHFEDKFDLFRFIYEKSVMDYFFQYQSGIHLAAGADGFSCRSGALFSACPEPGKQRACRCFPLETHGGYFCAARSTRCGP